MTRKPNFPIFHAGAGLLLAVRGIMVDLLKGVRIVSFTHFLFGLHNIWHTPVNDYAAVADDPQVRHNRCFVTIPGATGTPIRLVAHPIRYDGKAPHVRLPPQPLGAQTAEILRGWHTQMLRSPILRTRASSTAIALPVPNSRLTRLKKRGEYSLDG